MLMPHLLSNEITVQRFQNEGRAICELNHPNIINIQNFGMLNNRIPYLVMDYLKGKSLSTIISDKGNLDSTEAIKIFSQIANAVSHAHSKGIIHRDLKPSNVIITDEDNIVKILDFGIAKLIDSNKNFGSLTQTGDVFGSPYYMSPEQCKGEKLDERSDIYSLGCLMYETLTGRPPFIGQNLLESLHQQLNESPKSLKLVNPKIQISPELENIVLKCLNKDPKSRYQSMSELNKDLDIVQTGKTSFIQKLINIITLFLYQHKAKNIIIIICLTLISLLIFAFASNEFAEFNKISNMAFIKTEYDFKPLNFKEKKIEDPPEQFLFHLRQFMATIRQSDKLTGDDEDALDDYLTITKKYKLTQDAIELYCEQISKAILANSCRQNFLSDWFCLDSINTFLNLSHLIYQNSVKDYTHSIIELNSVKLLNDKLRELGQNKLANGSIRDLTIFTITNQFTINDKTFCKRLDLLTTDSLDIAESFLNENKLNDAIYWYSNSEKLLNSYLLEIKDITNNVNTANSLTDKYLPKANLSLTLSQLGKLYLLQGNDKQSANYLNTAINSWAELIALIKQNHEDESFTIKLTALASYNQALCYLNLANLYQLINNNNLSITYYDKSINILKDLSSNNVSQEYNINELIPFLKYKQSLLYLKNGNLLNSLNLLTNIQQDIKQNNLH